MRTITRRKDLGLGSSAYGGTSGSFAAHVRQAAEAPPVDPMQREVRDLDNLVREDPGSRVIGGSTEKFYDPINDSFVKLDAMHNEAVREEFASRAAVLMGLDDAVQYTAKQFRSATGELQVGVESPNFKRPDEMEKPLSMFGREEFVAEDDDEWGSDDRFYIENLEWRQLKMQIETMNGSTGADLHEDALRLAAFDIIVENADRTSNLSNIGVIKQADGGHRLIPPFDFGMAFPPRDEHEFLSGESFLDRAESFATFAREQYGHRGPLLNADQKELQAFIDSYDNPLYDEDEVQHIKAQLEDNLRATEGVLWRRRSRSETAES